ncbi:hypothetical protein NDU88_008710 [Pleurodeles waltl]|uniref:Uncharacterized protein n=1 Tax=Pleurodeles waltl TaxID=8319 RepID=A0AAV7QTJ9_PLEWA|nr:hypothetical protein NDU88_008710 [Pleurodeles waltl]
MPAALGVQEGRRCVSPLFRVAPSRRRSVSRSLLSPRPGESGRRMRGQAGEALAAQRLFRWSRQRGQREGARLLPQVSGRRFPPSRAGPPLKAAARAHAAGLRSVLRSPHGAAGESASALYRASARHRLWSFTYAPALHRRAPIVSWRHHPRPAARRLADLGS